MVDKNILKESIKHVTEIIRKDLDNAIGVMLERDDLEPEDKLFVLNLIRDNNFLPVGPYYTNSPNTIQEYLESSFLPRYKIYYFTKYLDYDISDDENANEIINEIWDYVKKYKIIGCINDW